MARELRLRKLRVLSLESCLGLRDRSIERVVRNVPTLNKLEPKDLPLITEVDVSSLVQLTSVFLTHCQRLATVSFGRYCRLTRFELFCLGGCPALTSVDFSGLAELSQIGNCFLTCCSALTRVDLSGMSKLEKIGTHFHFECLD